MASAGRAEPRCSLESAQKIVDLLKVDEEARKRWNTLLGRGISATMRDTYVAYNANRRRAAIAASPRSQRMKQAIL